MQPHHRGGGEIEKSRQRRETRGKKKKSDKRKLEVIKRKKIKIVSATGN
jgi:hypothetical protein